MTDFDKYRESVDAARDWFNKNHATVVATYGVLNKSFLELGECLRHGRDENDACWITRTTNSKPLGPLSPRGLRRLRASFQSVATPVGRLR
jgi:hypothetical protein